MTEVNRMRRALRGARRALLAGIATVTATALLSTFAMSPAQAVALTNASVSDATIMEGDEGTVNLAFTVDLSVAPEAGQTVTVDFETLGTGTALAGTDFVAQAPAQVTFLATESQKTVNVMVNGDTLDEPNETVDVQLSNLNGANGGTITNGTGTGTITDDDGAPTISIDDPVAVIEGTGVGSTTITYTATLLAASGQTVTVDAATSGGTATSGTDYTAVAPTTLTFAPGVTTQPVVVTVTRDALNEATETVDVVLSTSSNATILDGTGTSSITDDDAATATVSVNDPTVTEGSSSTVNLAYTVTLSEASGQVTTVDIATTGGTATAGTDYTAVVASPVTFDPGEITKTVNVVVAGDTLDETDETVEVTLSNNSAGIASIADGTGVGTITDDDATPTLSIADTSVVEGSGAGTTTLTYTVTLSAASGLPVSAVVGVDPDSSATDVTDFAAPSASVSFAAGETTKAITVVVVRDSLDETDETVLVELSGAVDATIADAAGIGTITDDDGPTISIADAVAVTEPPSGTTPANFVVTLSAVSPQSVLVTANVVNGTAIGGLDFTGTAQVLTFAPGETSKTLAVPVLSDARDEDTESFGVTLTTPVRATIADGSAAGSIVDNDDDASAPAIETAADAGDTVQTATPPSNDDPVQAGVTTPNAGVVTIVESNSTTFTAAGFQVLQFEVDVSAPPASPGSPLRITFGIAASQLTTGSRTLQRGLDDFTVFYNGGAIARCFGSTTANADGPCITSLAVSGGTVLVTVLAAQSDQDVSEVGVRPFEAPTSGWNFGLTDSAARPTGGGYRLVASDGGVFNYGNAAFHGSAGSIRLNQPIITMASTPDQRGYWLVASDGGVFSYGNAGFKGSAGGIKLNQPIVGMATTPDGGGYWMVASDGGIFSYGNAGFKGSAGGLRLNSPIVGMAATPDGGGYWLVAADGGIFSYGNAGFKGSAGGLRLNSPIVGMSAAPDGGGYWLVAADGGVFNYGNAAFKGSAGGGRLNSPIVGISASPDGGGYWLTARDGGVFSYGNAGFKGSAGGTALNRPIVAITPT